MNELVLKITNFEYSGSILIRYAYSSLLVAREAVSMAQPRRENVKVRVVPCRKLALASCAKDVIQTLLQSSVVLQMSGPRGSVLNVTAQLVGPRT
jgi:hypothetical protein